MMIFSDSRCLMLLNQAAPDWAKLAKLPHILKVRMGCTANTEAGHGLL
ncbi:hypothetical protein [uncultured Oscillibacter sp.]|nr:hypothetical protein [uncultured Oscillibacter sp.]